MHGAGIGGVENSIITLCRHLNRDLVEPIVVFPSEGPMKEIIGGMGIRTLVSPMEWMTPPRHLSLKNKERHHFDKFLSSLDKRVTGLADIISENGIDAIHTATITVAEGALASRITGVPHVWHIHGGYYDKEGFLPDRAVYSFVEGFSARIVTVSNTVKEFISGYISEKEKIEVVYNGIDIEGFGSKNKGPVLFKDYPHLKGRKIVALIGMVYPVKGIELYVDSAIEAARQREDTAFLVIGAESNKELASRMKEKISRSGLSERIIFTGFRDDVPSLLKDIDLVVCASVSEGFGYSVLESMTAGRPVVSTRCGGPEELVLDNETGCLVAKDKPGELANAVLSILNDRKKSLSMGQKAKERVNESFSAVKYARDFENIYSDVKKNSSRSSERPVWEEFLLSSLSNLGSLGKRVSELEQEVKDLNNFTSRLKGNVFFKTIKRVLNRP